MKRGDEALNAMNPGGTERRTSVEFYEVPVQTVTSARGRSRSIRARGRATSQRPLRRRLKFSAELRQGWDDHLAEELEVAVQVGVRPLVDYDV